MTFEEFLTGAQSLGKKLKRSRAPNEIEYLHALAETIPNITNIPSVDMENESSGWLWTLLDYKAPVGSVRMEFKKNGLLPIHDHRGYISLLYVVRGEVKVSHYSSNNISETRNSFGLEKEKEEILKEGEFSFATSESNIHSIEDLGAGSVLLDVSTFLRGRGDSFEINIIPSPNEDNEHTYQASWSGIKL